MTVQFDLNYREPKYDTYTFSEQFIFYFQSQDRIELI